MNDSMNTRTMLVGFGVGVGVLIAPFVFAAHNPHVRSSAAKPTARSPALFSWLSPVASDSASSAALNVLLENKGPATAVLLDVELYDQKGKKLYQEYKDDIELARNGSASLVFYPPPLASGSYHFGAGVFGAHWGKLQKWFYNMPEFSMGQ